VGVNDAPVARDDAFVLDEDSVLTVFVPGLLGNDSDVDSPVLNVVLVSGTTHGTLALNADGSFSYAPDVNYYGPDSFTYRASDGALESALATVALTINAVNDPPSALDDTASTNEDTPVTGNVLNGANGGADSDVEGDALTVLTPGSFTTALGATVTLEANGNFTYDPRGSAILQGLATGASRVDSFDYSITDGNGGTDTASVAVTVTGVDEPQAGSNQILPSLPLGVQLDYYVRFGDGSEWLRLEGFEAGLENAGSAVGTGSGGAAGKTFAQSPSLVLGSSSTVVDLLELVTSGKHLSGIDVEVYSQGGKDQQLVEEYNFDDVTITKLDSHGSGGATGNEVSFAFSRFSHGYVSYDEQGKLDGKSAAGWDFKLNEAFSDAPEADFKGKEAEGLAVDTPLSYYVKFAGGEGWLELDSLSLGLSNSGAGGTGGGAGAGKASAQDVKLVLGSSAEIVRLTELLAQGKHLADVEIEAYRLGGKEQQLIDEYKFEDVLLTALHDAGSESATLHELSFDYARISHGHVEYDAGTGKQAGADVASWDFELNKAWTDDLPHPDVDFLL
jgi:VCBS repeat-containing protein